MSAGTVVQDKTRERQTDTSPFAAFEWMLAGRYLRARRKEGFVSVIAAFSFLGILLGVATLIIVRAVMNGFREDLLGKMLGLNGHVIAHSSRLFTDYDKVAKDILKVSGVTNAIPLVEGQIMVSTPARANGALVRGVRENDLKTLDVIASNLVAGKLDGFDGRPSLIIGAGMAKNMGVGLGGFISLINPRGVQTPFGTSPRVKRYPVSAIFKLGMDQYDSSIVFMPLHEGQKFFNRKRRVDAIEILVNSPDRVKGMMPELRRAAPPDVKLTDWTHQNSSLFNALAVERNVMFLILTLIIIVAAFNIISGMVMLVKDKARDIAVLRTMGATQWSIMRVFLITGASIGVVGTLAGLLLGLLVSYFIEPIRQFISKITGVKIFDPSLYQLEEMPSKIIAGEVFQVVMMAMILSVLATLYPAWRAAKMDPVEALRYE